MRDIFDITPEKAAKSVRAMAELLDCDYETVWEQYTHQLIKDLVSWDDVKALLEEKEQEKRND